MNGYQWLRNYKAQSIYFPTPDRTSVGSETSKVPPEALAGPPLIGARLQSEKLELKGMDFIILFQTKIQNDHTLVVMALKRNALFFLFKKT